MDERDARLAVPLVRPGPVLRPALLLHSELASALVRAHHALKQLFGELRCNISQIRLWPRGGCVENKYANVIFCP